MIPDSAIKQFLSQPRDDHRYLKELDAGQLDQLLSELAPAPLFWVGLDLHQKVALYLGLVHRCLGVWLDMGLGKTLVALELLQYWWDLGKLRRALIFVTSDKAFPTWERQIRQYNISIPYCILDASSSEGKWDILEKFDQGLILLHYPGTVAMCSARIKKDKKGKFVLSPKKLDRLLSQVDGLVMDESTKASGIHSLTFKICRAASQQAKFRYALAGMPFGRDPTPLWSQMYLVDHGETLGPTLGLFRKAFFTAKPSFWGGPYSEEYKFDKRKEPLLSKILQHRSITYATDECKDLPPERNILEEVSLPLDTREYYNQIVEEAIAAQGNMRAMKNVFLRMRQLSSGFLGLKDDETGERAEIEFEQNPKLDRLLELLGDLPPQRKALIFYQYTYSGRRISEALKALDLRSIWLWSGTKNAKATLMDFIENPKTTVAVINNQVGAYSLDGLQIANYTLFYEAPVSVIDYNQAKKRTLRQGQVHKTVFFYDLVMKNTVDMRILDFHAEGKELFQSLLTNPRGILCK